jgi:hypothetical protein
VLKSFNSNIVEIQSLGEGHCIRRTYGRVLNPTLKSLYIVASTGIVAFLALAFFIPIAGLGLIGVTLAICAVASATVDRYVRGALIRQERVQVPYSITEASGPTDNPVPPAV